MIFGAFPFIILDLSPSHLVSQLCLWGDHFLWTIDEMVVIELASLKRLFFCLIKGSTLAEEGPARHVCYTFMQRFSRYSGHACIIRSIYVHIWIRMAWEWLEHHLIFPGQRRYEKMTSPKTSDICVEPIIQEVIQLHLFWGEGGGEWVTGWCHPQKLPGFLSKEHQVQKLNALREQISLASHSSKWQKVLNLLSDHLTVASAYGWSLAISACAKASQWRQALALYAAGGRDAVVCAAVIGSCQRTVTFLKWKWLGEL